MDTDLLQVHETVGRAICPEDVFGVLVGGKGEAAEAALEASYRRLARACHPDRHHADADEADVSKETFQRLAEWRTRAVAKLQSGTYGRREASSAPEDAGESTELRTARRTYRVRTTPFVEGDFALLYRGICQDGEGPEARVVVKQACREADNDLLLNEIRVLTRLGRSPSGQSKHLPVLLEPFRSGPRQGLILREIDALDGTTLREKLPGGVPAEHAAWILSRLLSVLGFAHSRGILHGNVEPAHLMVRPKDHNLFLIDWTCAVVEPARTGEAFRTLNEVYGPPEVEARKPPIPASDLYSAGKTMIFLLGGDPGAGTLPEGVPDRLVRFLRFLTLPGSAQRAQDAWEMHHELAEARREIWGPPRFVPFEV